MKRPIKYKTWITEAHLSNHSTSYQYQVYKCTDIDPLLDELERLKADKKPFPSYEEFTKWLFTLFELDNIDMEDVYEYFSQFRNTETVYPKMGEEYEFSNDKKTWFKKPFMGYDAGLGCLMSHIRPVTTPTRDEVIAKYGITPDDLEILKG